jgi:HEAT repeat protein
MIRINDNGFIPEGSPLEGYEPSRRPHAYPLRRVMRLAARAIERSPANVGALIGRLEDDNEVVRYWAAQGLVMLNGAGQGAVAALRERLTREPSIHVRVIVAEALARSGDLGAPVAFLAETLDAHDDARVRLLALNALTYLPAGALEPFEDVIERAASHPDEYVANAGRYLAAVLAGTYDPFMP